MMRLPFPAGLNDVPADTMGEYYFQSQHTYQELNRKSPSTVPFCSETKQKRLLGRLDLVWLINVFRKGQVGSENRSKVFSFVTAYTSLKSIPASVVK